jgi:hypothetical protein
MNHHHHHFFVTLPSDNSLHFFEDNTVAHFRTKLAERIELDGEYEVGLAELIYPHSWYNLDNVMRQYWVGVKSEGRELRAHYIKSGYYIDGNVFANDLTKQCAKTFADITDFTVKFNYNHITNKFSVDVQTKGVNNLLYMSAEMQKLLGLVIGTGPIGNQVVIANNVYEPNRGLNLLYVYCDVASYVTVGHTKAPLLRVSSVGGKYGEMVRTIFTHPHYVPVSRRHFDVIEININSEMGTPMPFLNGKSVVTLHFRRRHSLLAAS